MYFEIWYKIIWFQLISLIIRLMVAIERPGLVSTVALIAMAFCWDDEFLLMAAVMADAGDDGLMFIRMWDTPNPETADMNVEVKAFIDKTVRLYWNGDVFNSPGHTRYMCQWLESEHVYIVNGRTHTIGGPGAVERVKGKVMGRMQAYVVLAKATTEAEFPCFELVAAFNTLRLKEWDELTANGGPGYQQNMDLDRLSKAFKCDVDRLKLQFFDHGKRAAVHHNTKTISVQEAWRKSFTETKRVDIRERHPVDEIKD